MRWFKLLDNSGKIIGAEAIEEPSFVVRLKNGTVQTTGNERTAQGVVSADGSALYQLVGRPLLNDPDVRCMAQEITEGEYQEIMQDPPDPEDDDPEIPDGSDPETKPMSRAELTEAVEALEKANTLLTGMLLENREEEMKASRAYSPGDLIVVNGTLYTAISRIASGAALTANTNVQQTTLAAEIAAAKS